VEDKPGLINEITAIMTRSHVNVLAVNTITNSRFPSFRIKCDLVNKEKIEKLIVKLKKIKEVREISYVFI